MIFNNENAKHIRLNKKLSLISVARVTGVSRGTLWHWEKGNIVPVQSKIRQLAKALKVHVSDISDLENEIPKASESIKQYSETWDFFIDANRSSKFDRIDSFIHNINSFKKTLEQVYVIIDAILDSSEFMFYLKDISLKYVVANRLFLSNCSLNPDFNVLGCDDSIFFNLKDTKLNEKEDEEVLLTGKGLRREGFIPGSKGKKWGIIVKKPIFNMSDKIAGVKGAFIDISSRKKTENVRELLERNINFLDVGVSLTDYNKKKVLYVNKAFSELFGIEPDILYSEGSKAFSNIVHHDYIDCIDNINYFPTEDLPYKRIEYRIYKNNKIRWIESIRSYRTLQGRKYIFSMNRDISELKKLQSLKKDISTNSKIINELKNYLAENDSIPKNNIMDLNRILNKLID
ncbi:MAG TPA: PAS domain S-box protein [Victivallales bacterium]|nr:PAS domain S-box protein [Victivallales bacterium]